MIETNVRDSLYKSVSKFWYIYRNTDSINANIMFTLREIRTCLRKIKDDKSRVISKGGVNVIVSVVQKEYVSAFNAALLNLINVSKKKNLNFLLRHKLNFILRHSITFNF